MRDSCKPNFGNNFIKIDALVESGMYEAWGFEGKPLHRIIRQF